MSIKNDHLSRREREIMDILYELNEATAQEVRARLSDPPSNSAARALLAKLEKKGLIGHIERDLRYVYVPKISHQEASKSALSRMVRVFYEGSFGQAVTGMVQQSGEKLSDDDFEKLEQAIEAARERRKKS